MDIIANTNEYVDRAVRDNTFGNEGVDHAVGLSIVPDANGQPTMVTTIVLRMSSVIVGESHTIGFFVNTPVPTQPEIDVAIKKALEDLRKMREADLNAPKTGTGSQGLLLK